MRSRSDPHHASLGLARGLLKSLKQQANRQMFCRLASAVALLAFLDMATAQFSLRAA